MERGNLTKYEKHVYKQIFKSLEYISSLLALQFGSVSVCICVQKMLTPLLLPFEMPQNHYAHQYHAVDTGQSRSCRAPLPPASLTPIVMERCGPALECSRSGLERQMCFQHSYRPGHHSMLQLNFRSRLQASLVFYVLSSQLSCQKKGLGKQRFGEMIPLKTEFARVIFPIYRKT